jgi:hypothetical protein
VASSRLTVWPYDEIDGVRLSDRHHPFKKNRKKIEQFLDSQQMFLQAIEHSGDSIYKSPGY